MIDASTYARLPRDWPGRLDALAQLYPTPAARSALVEVRGLLAAAVGAAVEPSVSSRFTVARDVLANIGMEVYGVRTVLELNQLDVESAADLPHGMVGRLERREVRQLPLEPVLQLLTWLDEAHLRRSSVT